MLRIRMNRLTPRNFVWQICVALLLVLLNALSAGSQDKRTKIRISNAGFTITALPLLAAKDWGVFNANGLDVELIVMSPSLAAAAVAQGDIDYVAGVGPASVAATLTGLPSRAIWFSSDRISYWLQSAPLYKTIQDLKGKKIAISGGAGGTNHVALLIALEKASTRKISSLSGSPDSNCRCFTPSNPVSSKPRCSLRRTPSAPRAKDSINFWTSAPWSRCRAAA